METITTYTRIGQALKAYGLSGAVLADIEAPFIDLFLASDFVFLEISGSVVPFYIEGVFDHAPLFRLHLEDVNDPDQAAMLVPAELFLPSDLSAVDAVPLESKRFAWCAGFMMFDDEGNEIGTIERIEAFPQQELAILTRGGNEVMIPLHEQLITDVDRELKTIHVRIPEGLLDL